jgi:hypothetical protein
MLRVDGRVREDRGLMRGVASAGGVGGRLETCLQLLK